MSERIARGNTLQDLSVNRNVILYTVPAGFTATIRRFRKLKSTLYSGGTSITVKKTLSAGGVKVQEVTTPVLSIAGTLTPQDGADGAEAYNFFDVSQQSVRFKTALDIFIGSNLMGKPVETQPIETNPDRAGGSLELPLVLGAGETLEMDFVPSSAAAGSFHRLEWDFSVELAVE